MHTTTQHVDMVRTMVVGAYGTCPNYAYTCVWISILISLHHTAAMCSDFGATMTEMNSAFRFSGVCFTHAAHSQVARKTPTPFLPWKTSVRRALRAHEPQRHGAKLLFRASLPRLFSTMVWALPSSTDGGCYNLRTGSAPDPVRLPGPNCGAIPGDASRLHTR